MSERLLIRGGRIFDPGNGFDFTGSVLVEGNTIARITADDVSADGARVVDASGRFVVPGFVDLHAHLREPGFEQKGTIASETAAALKGGFTTICAMPNTSPAPDSAPVLRDLLERIARDAAVRVFAIGCVTKGRKGTELAEIGELADAGCVAFSDDGDPVADAQLMRHAMEHLADRGLPISEHSDDPVLNGGGVINEGRVSERLGLAGQPPAAEISAIARDLALAEASGARLHVAHVSTARAVELIAEAKQRGVRVTCEVTPSHLFLTEDAVFGNGAEPAYDTNARVNPPLRTEADRQALVTALNAGIIDAIATDHAPHAIEDKLCEFDLAAPGISCFETAAGTIMEQVARGELQLERVIEALTKGPVRAFSLDGLVPGIGELREGGTADIALLDPRRSWVVDPASFVSKGKNTPLGGTALRGSVAGVVSRGSLTTEAPAHV